MRDVTRSITACDRPDRIAKEMNFLFHHMGMTDAVAYMYVLPQCETGVGNLQTRALGVYRTGTGVSIGHHVRDSSTPPGWEEAGARDAWYHAKDASRNTPTSYA